MGKEKRGEMCCFKLNLKDKFLVDLRAVYFFYPESLCRKRVGKKSVAVLKFAVFNHYLTTCLEIAFV